MTMEKWEDHVINTNIKAEDTYKALLALQSFKIRYKSKMEWT